MRGRRHPSVRVRRRRARHTDLPCGPEQLFGVRVFDTSAIQSGRRRRGFRRHRRRNRRRNGWRNRWRDGRRNRWRDGRRPRGRRRRRRGRGGARSFHGGMQSQRGMPDRHVPQLQSTRHGVHEDMPNGGRLPSAIDRLQSAGDLPRPRMTMASRARRSGGRVRDTSAKRTVVLACSALLTLLFACSSEGARACYPGDYQACSCTASAEDTPRTGYAACSSAGDGFGACDCSGRTPGLDETRAVRAEDLGNWLAQCDSDAECTTGLCFSFNMKGKRCSRRCTSASECPPPSAGCNNQGVCKAP